MLNQLSVREFARQVASGSPAPGGGSVAALSASMGAGLISMLANLTIGKAGYESHEETFKMIAKNASELSDEFALYIDTDANAFDGYMEAMRLPKSTEEEKQVRANAMQQAVKNAANVPLNLAKMAFSLVESAKFCVLNGNKNALSDGMVAMLMLRSAVLGAIFNVKINLGLIKDEQFKQDLLNQIAPMEAQISSLESQILSLATL